MRSFLLTGMSFVLTGAVITNAWYQKQQFYPSVVYITKSNPSMAIMYVQALVFVVLVGKLLRLIFFGQLRAAEMEHLIERSWYAVTETCLAFTVFRDDFSPRFVALFTLLLFLKSFHWLAEDRIDFMERSPAISWIFHLRVLSLMFVLGVLDCLFVRHAFHTTITKGPSVQLVFGFEYEILLTVVFMIFIKYVLHSIDLRSENPWDNKAVYLLYSELIIGFIRVVLYILFVAIMIKVHTFPLFAIRPMYLTLRAFQKAAQDVILSRRAIQHMNTLYPDATEEELQSGDNVCIICREDMVSGAKKLPCNHIFHTSCLRSWFQRQQTCPTCRLEVLRMPRQQQTQPQPEMQQPAAPPPQQPFNNIPGFGGFPFNWPPPPPPPHLANGQPGQLPFAWPPQQQQQHQQQPEAANATPTSQPQAGASTTSSPSSSSSTVPPPPPFTMPPFMPGMPGISGMPGFGSLPGMPPPMPPMYFPMVGFPAPPTNMSGLSEEQLRAMEGRERENIEARIHWLKDIQALFDGAMLLVNQYNTLSSQMGMQNIQFNRPRPEPQTNESASTSQPPSSGQSNGHSPTWWPAGQGARPKYSSTVTKTETTNSEKTKSSSKSKPDESKENEEEGATGYSPPTVTEEVPEWEDPRQEGHEDSMHEVRKRRLQHFQQSSTNRDADKDIDDTELS